MKISETYELENGSVRFEGVIEGPELDLVIQAGLLTLMRDGVIHAAYIEKLRAEDTGDVH